MTKKVLPIAKLFPNIITLIALCLGLSSIRFALELQWLLSISMVVTAAVLDLLDGRIARLLNATSNFGAQLDSLADFLNFGIAPALILYNWSLKFTHIKGLGWGVTLFTVVCCAIRLARFNTDMDSDDRPKWLEGFFVGVPSTFAGFLLICPIMVELEYQLNLDQHPILLSIYIIIISLLMVSKIPTFSTKRLVIRHEFISLTLVSIGVLIAAIIMEPWVILPVVGFLYLITIPFSIIYHKKIREQKIYLTNINETK